MSNLPGKRRAYQDHLRYKHMVARLDKLPFYALETAVLAEIAKGRRWRIDAALEALAKSPDRYNFINYIGIFEACGKYGRLTGMERLTTIYKSEKIDRGMDDVSASSHGIAEAFDAAVIHGHYRVAEFLRSFGARADIMLNNNRNPRAMAIAIHHNDLQKVDYLLKCGASATYHLGYARHRKNLPLVERFLDAGADVNYKSEGHWTALHLAARDGNAPMVELLLSRGATVAACANDLMYDVIRLDSNGSHRAIFERLLALGAKLDERSLKDAAGKGWISPKAAVPSGPKQG